MLAQIFSLLLDVLVSILAGSCLIRLYMQYQRVAFQHPVGRFVMAVTDWIVLPLRKVLPRKPFDWSSLVAAYLIELAAITLVWALGGQMSVGAMGAFWGHAQFGLVAIGAVFELAILFTWIVFWMLLVYAILSWTRSESMAFDIIDDMCSPLLRPFRRMLPMVGGVDLSPLALCITLQIARIVLVGIFVELVRVF